MGPRTTRRGTQPQSIPGSLDSTPGEPESQYTSLDQPVEGGDRPLRRLELGRSLDQLPAGSGDRRDESLDQRQPSGEGGDRLDEGLDQSSHGDGDGPSIKLREDEGEQGTDTPTPEPRNKGPEGQEGDSDLEPPEEVEKDGEGSPGRATDEEKRGSGTPEGSPPNRREWRKVIRRSGSPGARSEDSKDVEDLLDAPSQADDARYFQKWLMSRKATKSQTRV